MDVWVYVLIGLGVLIALLVPVCYCFLKARQKMMVNELFEGESFCILVQAFQGMRGVLGKRKIVPKLKLTKTMPNQLQINELYNYYHSEEISSQEREFIKQCFENLKAFGVKVDELASEEGSYYSEEEEESEQASS